MTQERKSTDSELRKVPQSRFPIRRLLHGGAYARNTDLRVGMAGLGGSESSIAAPSGKLQCRGRAPSLVWRVQLPFHGACQAEPL